MAGWTNKGKYEVLGYAYVSGVVPTNYYIGLWTSATAPDQDINTFGQGTQINTGNGYADGGYQLTPGGTDFDVHTEDDTNDRGLVQIKDIVWTASGGPIPASGSGARYALLTDDNVTVANREVYHYWDLTSDRQVSDGQTLTLQDCEIRINES
jgi:hypothetical protein